MSHVHTLPRLLVVEDDPVSLSFLSEALAALPAMVDAARNIAQALDLASRNKHLLWLIDAHLPDGDGCDCLSALRRLQEAPALAITAGVSPEELDSLCSSGFLEVLPKPVSVALLQATVRRLLGEQSHSVREPAGAKLPVWDEQRALSAIGGSRSSLLALRKLFLDELPVLRQQLIAAHGAQQADVMHSILHKLTASCGFVGAVRLGQAVAALMQAPLDADAFSRFEFAAADALDGRDDQA